ncbi:MAG: aldo/keto reductase [Verrucomicrobiales bacterium]|jgi:D-threo-aldose 1-dehydrogenase|nr:aldo/keto reductase [Verrucomicrobiales bacterium]MDP4790668.1 aldo/keto reductase [Verrucomicrobiales bacterium]MDP4938301.1 aldo/keto reductase [Verrucomicrobiales bacterium]MDP5006792.1 aldo/keto reductase [Verrucomicrobiales bacterium]
MDTFEKSPALVWPRIVFGTTPLGNIYQVVEESVKHDLVANWFRHAKRPVFIDSAGKYGAGLALESLAKNLSALGIAPSDVVISNKLGWKRAPLLTPEPTFEPGAWFGLEHDAVQCISYEGILECHAEGNALLAPYETQLLSVHDPDEYLAAASSEADREKRYRDILDAYRALFELKAAGQAEGKTNSVGVGAKNWTVIRRLWDDGVALDWVMFANSYTIMRHPVALRSFMDELHRAGVAIVNSAIFHGGFLTGGEFFDYRRVTRESDPALFDWRDRFYDVCARHEIAPATAAAQFGLSHPGVVGLALSTSQPERVRDLIDLTEGTLPASLLENLVQGGLVEGE